MQKTILTTDKSIIEQDINDYFNKDKVEFKSYKWCLLFFCHLLNINCKHSYINQELITRFFLVSFLHLVKFWRGIMYFNSYLV